MVTACAHAIDNCPNTPGHIGDACNDGNANTVNDVILANCTCAGTPGNFDCAGVANGTAAIDQCGVCAGGTTGIVPNSTCLDCLGVPNGTAQPGSACNDNNANTQNDTWDANYTCAGTPINFDCAGVANGTAAIDQCGVCAGGTTGVIPNMTCTDCSGIVNGTAAIDQCGVCAVGTTKDTPNYNDRGKLSMARTTARLNIDWTPVRDVSVVTKLRAVGEAKTSFLNHLEKMGAYNYGDASGRGDIMALYKKNDIGDVIREMYVDLPVGDRSRLRLGKHQVVWGETDFFAANDLVHGFDYTWRSFLETSNEELRKANIIAKLNVDVPELDGGVEMFVRPGWDRKSDIGTELDVFGGRWSSQSVAGTDFRNIDPYYFRNNKNNKIVKVKKNE